MQAFELRKKSIDELRALLREGQVRREAAALAIHQKKQKNVRELRTLRRDIARVQTIIAERGRQAP